MFVKRLMAHDDLSILEPFSGWTPDIWEIGSGDTRADRSIFALLEVLLKPRIPEGTTEHWMALAVLQEENPYGIIEYLYETYGVEENFLAFVTFSEVAEINVPEGFEEQRDITAYFEQRNIKMRVLIDREHRRTLVYIEKMHITSFHVAGTVVSRFLPWYFVEGGMPLDEKERELVSTLKLRDPERFVEIMEELTKERFNFRDQIIMAALDDYGKNYIYARKKALQDQVEHLYREIDSLLAEMNDRKKRIFERTLQINGLEVDRDTNEFRDFLLGCKNVDILEFDDRGNFSLAIKTTLSNYDRDATVPVIENIDSYIYDNRHDWDCEDARELLRAIFVDERFRIKMYGVLNVNLLEATASSIRGFREIPGYLSNQHLYRYACLGNNLQEIEAALRSGNDIGTIYAMIASVGNVNVSESVSNDVFFSKLFETEDKVLLTEDGKDVSPKEALEILHSESEGKEDVA